MCVYVCWARRRATCTAICISRCFRYTVNVPAYVCIRVQLCGWLCVCVHVHAFKPGTWSTPPSSGLLLASRDSAPRSGSVVLPNTRCCIYIYVYIYTYIHLYMCVLQGTHTRLCFCVRMCVCCWCQRHRKIQQKIKHGEYMK